MEKFNRFKYTPPPQKKYKGIKTETDELDNYQEMCYERSIQELEKLTWIASTGEVIFGEILFRLEEIEKKLEEMEGRL
jgi:hypothetical protein